jgi:hypothetical protein
VIEAAGSVLVSDPPPTAAASTVAAMTGALDAVRTFTPKRVIADISAPPPAAEKVSDVARHAGTVPLVLLGFPSILRPAARGAVVQQGRHRR